MPDEVPGTVRDGAHPRSFGKRRISGWDLGHMRVMCHICNTCQYGMFNDWKGLGFRGLAGFRVSGLGDWTRRIGTGNNGGWMGGWVSVTISLREQGLSTSCKGLFSKAK
jgi:hypothetical protein